MIHKRTPAPARRRIVTGALFVLAVAAAFIAGLMMRGTRPVPEARPGSGIAAAAEDHPGEIIRLDEATQSRIGLRLAPAEQRTLKQTIQATGSVGPDETRMAHIRALARGRIDTVHVRLGDRVRAGQPLLVYDNADLGEAIGQYLSALSAIEKAMSEAEVAKRAADRATNLVELGAIARAEFDRRSAEYRNSLASVESLKAEAAKEEEKLHRFGMTDGEIGKLSLRAESQYHRKESHTAIAAPFAGVITDYNAVPGELVGPDDQLLIIADLSVVWVQADIYEKDIAAVQERAAVSVCVDACPGRAFAGKVTYISDIFDPRTRTAKVRCEVPNPDGLLKLGMSATIRIPAPTGRQAILVPIEAIQRIEEQPVAFVKTGTAEFEIRALKLGEKSNGWIEVLEGIRAAEQVVTEGSFILKSETRKAELGHHEE